MKKNSHQQQAVKKSKAVAKSTTPVVFRGVMENVEVHERNLPRMQSDLDSDASNLCLVIAQRNEIELEACGNDLRYVMLFALNKAKVAYPRYDRDEIVYIAGKVAMWIGKRKLDNYWRHFKN